MKTNRVLIFAATVLSALAFHPAFAQVVTYDWTGVVTADVDSYPSVSCDSKCGETISGTYTLNYGAGNSNSGTPGDSSGSDSWSVTSASGSTYAGYPANAPFVFTTTSNNNIFNYSTITTGTYENVSGICNCNGTNSMETQEIVMIPYGNGNEIQEGSGFALTAASGGPSAFDSNGFPTYSAGLASATGYFSSNGIYVSYDITSMTEVSPTPLPPSAWMMLSGLIGLGFVTYKKR
jgi:hypothetical protein